MGRSARVESTADPGGTRVRIPKSRFPERIVRRGVAGSRAAPPQSFAEQPLRRAAPCVPPAASAQSRPHGPGSARFPLAPLWTIRALSSEAEAPDRADQTLAREPA